MDETCKRYQSYSGNVRRFVYVINADQSDNMVQISMQTWNKMALLKYFTCRHINIKQTYIL